MKGSIEYTDSMCQYSVIPYKNAFKATFVWKSKHAWGRKVRMFGEERYGIEYIHQCVEGFERVRQYYNLTGALIE